MAKMKKVGGVRYGGNTKGHKGRIKKSVNTMTKKGKKPPKT